MHKVLRLIVTINLVAFAVLLVTTGSAMPFFRHGWISDIIDDWWFVSTAAIVIMFLVLLVRKFRGKGAPARFWLDVALFVAWACAFGLVILIGARHSLDFNPGQTS